MTELIVFGEHTMEQAVFFRRRVFRWRGKRFVVKSVLWSFGVGWSHTGDALLAEDGSLDDVAEISMRRVSVTRDAP